MRKVDMKKKSRKEKIQNGEGESDAENKTDESKTQVEAVSSSSEAESNKVTEPPTKKKKSSKRKSSSSKKSKTETESNKEIDSKKDKEEKSDQEEKDNDEDDQDEQYEVEKIIDEKFVNGIRHYLIRWKGYEPESDSWEPESTLACAELIQKFKTSQKENTGGSPSKKNKNKKSKSKNSSPKKAKEVVDWQSDDEFEVDRILEVYFKKNGKREFLVSWKGYALSQASWEPEENLDCDDLITKFMNKVEEAKNVEQKELRVNRSPTKRFTLNMYSRSEGRRLSRRLDVKERVQYFDAE